MREDLLAGLVPQVLLCMMPPRNGSGPLKSPAGPCVDIGEPHAIIVIFSPYSGCDYPGWLGLAGHGPGRRFDRIAGRRIGELAELKDEIAAWSTDVNRTQRGVDWQMKIDDARCKLKSVYPQIKL